MKPRSIIPRKHDGLLSDNDKVLAEFRTRIDDAIASDDPNKIAKAQLEVSWAQMQYLQRIDWKIWELYNLYVKQ